MLDVVWLNLVELSKQKTFREILSSVTSTEKEWKKWFDTDAPEEEDIPCGYQVQFHPCYPVKISHVFCITSSSGFFGCLPEAPTHPILLSRQDTCTGLLKEMRLDFIFLDQARKYIYSSLGADFLENAVLDIEHLLEESDNKVAAQQQKVKICIYDSDTFTLE